MAALADFSKHVLIEVPMCPQPVVNEAVLRACIEFCERTALFDEKTVVETEAGDDMYALAFNSGLVAHRVLYVKRGDSPLSRSSRDLADGAAGDLGATGAPTMYYLNASDMLVLAPVPDSVETLTVKAIVKPAQTATAVPDSLAAHWMLGIAAGAKAFLFSQKGTAWYDPEASLTKASQFSQAIDKAITQQRAGRSGTQSRVVMRPAA
jgi:hypothetical protein